MVGNNSGRTKSMSVIVERYLGSLNGQGTGGEGPWDEERIDALIARHQETIDKTPSYVKRLKLVQKIHNLEEKKKRLNDPAVNPHEAPFVAIAKQYSDHWKIGYQAWRDLGVTPEVLRKAGIRRGKNGTDPSTANSTEESTE